ncbi:hypothetical protein [Streptosporangium carneum]|uniref:Peptidase n=1 Tax=Streptosporangium carneum TaxID=47481 RepID=A0A9W6ME92_9ACTN|nr:hypothetical protein [Streptosporangium carneum]GLK10720.1 hypothetical protein GCM10017600_41260 [Streptosporangium carneum]
MRIRSILSVTLLAGGLGLFCQPAHAVVSEPRQGAVVVTDVVEYECTTAGVVETQDVKVKVELTVPAKVTVNEPMTVGWHGSYADDVAVLRAPVTGLDDGVKLYAYASFSGIKNLSSATGVGELAVPEAGEVIPLPTAVLSLATRSRETGTAEVRPAAINVGTRSNDPVIQCQVRNRDALTTYPLAVVSADDLTADPAPVTSSPQPTPTATAEEAEAEADGQTGGSDPETSAPQPVRATPTTVARAAANGNGRVTRTPSGAAATGGGGESGPDGRVLVLTGFLLALTAATGLLLRRRGLSGR